MHSIKHHKNWILDIIDCASFDNIINVPVLIGGYLGKKFIATLLTLFIKNNNLLT